MRIAVLGFLLAVYLAIPWVRWSPAQGFAREAPRVVSGDEPHYLIILNNLLREHDLLLDDDYARVLRGGLDAGVGFRGVQLDHHTIAVDRSTGEHQLWQKLYQWRRPQSDGTFPRALPGLTNGYVEVPAHPPAFPALIALFVWPFRGDPGLVEQLGIETVALLSFFALCALLLAARSSGFTASEGLAAALLAGLASPMLAYARSFFSEPALALFLTLALWALQARKPALCGALCFLAAAIKPPFGLIALGWAALRFRQGRWREEALPLLAVFGIGCAALAVFNWQLAHTPFISGSSGFEPVHGTGNIGVLLFSDDHGLFAFVPWALAGLIAGARWPELAWGAFPVLFLLAINDAGGGGTAYGPRYFVPLLPWLALATVRAWRVASKRWRAGIAVLVAIGFVLAIPGALRYRDLFARPAIDALRK